MSENLSGINPEDKDFAQEIIKEAESGKEQPLLTNLDKKKQYARQLLEEVERYRIRLAAGNIIDDTTASLIIENHKKLRENEENMHLSLKRIAPGIEFHEPGFKLLIVLYYMMHGFFVLGFLFSLGLDRDFTPLSVLSNYWIIIKIFIIIIFLTSSLVYLFKFKEYFTYCLPRVAVKHCVKMIVLYIIIYACPPLTAVLTVMYKLIKLTANKIRFIFSKIITNEVILE